MNNQYPWNEIHFCDITVKFYNKELPFPGGTVVKTPLANLGDGRDASSIPGSRLSLGGGNGNPLQHSYQRILVGYSLGESHRVGHDWALPSQAAMPLGGCVLGCYNQVKQVSLRFYAS